MGGEGGGEEEDESPPARDPSLYESRARSPYSVQLWRAVLYGFSFGSPGEEVPMRCTSDEFYHIALEPRSSIRDR